MQIEAFPTVSTNAETVQAKAVAQLLAAESNKLRQALVEVRSAIEAGEVIQAYGIAITALSGEGK